VLNNDMLAPEGYGEIIGGSQREDDYDRLLARIREQTLPEEAYSWYLDLRKYGTFVHSGFGLGVERTVAWICGIAHIREAIAFPRTLYKLWPRRDSCFWEGPRVAKSVSHSDRTARRRQARLPTGRRRVPGSAARGAPIRHGSTALAATHVVSIRALAPPVPATWWGEVFSARSGREVPDGPRLPSGRNVRPGRWPKKRWSTSMVTPGRGEPRGGDGPPHPGRAAAIW
jgi:hypothetical protein